MELFVKEYEVTKPTIGLLAVRIKSAMGIPMNKYMHITNEHQLKMVAEEPTNYKLINLCLQDVDKVIFTSNGIIGEKLPSFVIDAYLRSRREIDKITVIKQEKGYEFIGIKNYTYNQLTELLKLYDLHIKDYLVGKTTRLTPKEFIVNNLKNL